MKLNLLILLYFYAFYALINLCLGYFTNCVVTNALHTLCTYMYHYDCFYICKDLTEGEKNQSINQNHTRVGLTRGVIGSMQRPLPDNIQHSHDTDIHTVGGIRYRNTRRRASADPRSRPRAAFTQLPQFARVSCQNTFKDLKVKCGGLGPVSMVATRYCR